MRKAAAILFICALLICGACDSSDSSKNSDDSGTVGTDISETRTADTDRSAANNDLTYYYGDDNRDLTTDSGPETSAAILLPDDPVFPVTNAVTSVDTAAGVTTLSSGLPVSPPNELPATEYVHADTTVTSVSSAEMGSVVPPSVTESSGTTADYHPVSSRDGSAAVQTGPAASQSSPGVNQTRPVTNQTSVPVSQTSSSTAPDKTETSPVASSSATEADITSQSDTTSASTTTGGNGIIDLPFDAF